MVSATGISSSATTIVHETSSAFPSSAKNTNFLKSKTSTSWPLLLSVDIQSMLLLLCTVYVSFLAPFPNSVVENEHLNFIHDYIYGKLDRFQSMNSKFSSFLLLGITYAPSKLATRLFGGNSLNVLLVIKVFLALLSVLSWRFLQKRISFNYGSRVAFLNFLFEFFNWTSLDQSSRFVETNVIRSMCMVSFGLLLEKKFMLSIGIICLTIPVLRETSLNLLSSLLPLFLNREIFEKDPLALFSYLSISGVITAVSNSITDFDLFQQQHQYSPLLIMISVFPIVFGLIWKNFVILKYSLVHCIGLLLFKNQIIHFSFISLAWSLTISQLSLNQGIPQAFALIYSVIFVVSGFRSTNLSPAGWASLKLSDILIDETKNCPDSIKIHISKSSQALGFSKFSAFKHPKLTFEFGTLYSEEEMIQKFKYRVADIDENVDPAYWRVKFVQKGIESISESKSNLKVKILSRIQASDL